MKIKLFYLMLFICFYSFGQTVNIEGDPYSGNPYATITDAITAATDGDVILITGVHTESISFGKSITLRGTDPTTDIIQASASASSDGSGSRVVSVNEGDFTITIENLGIQHGNARTDNEQNLVSDGAGNGGGINIEKVTGMVTLKNLIIKNNYTVKNGGGVTTVGSIVDIIDCTIADNSSGSAAGGLMLASNNGSAVNSVVNIKKSLINNNSANNGGGIYLNGNPGFGEKYTIDLNIENTTISNNTATSGTGGAGGGAIWTKSANYSPADVASGNANTSLNLVHVTTYNNQHSAVNKSGIQFTGSFATNFSIYNSLILNSEIDVNGTPTLLKAINFANSNTTDVVNSILGSLNAAPNSIIDDANKNNSKGKTDSFAGISTLSDEGGNTQVFSFAEGSNADDYCTAATGITLPTVDQRDYMREGTADAGAFEFGGTLSLKNIKFNKNVSFYPNPSNNIISINGLSNIKTIKVYSIIGALEKRIINSDSFTVNGLTKGVHFAIIESEEGTFTSKFIVN